MLILSWFLGNISNSATFVNEDGFIKLKKWSPPSHGVISLYFRTPYAKGTILYNGDDSKEYFRLMIFNETTVRLVYDIGNGGTTVDLSLKNKKVNDTAWHKVVIFRNMKEFGMELDEEKGVNNNPLFLKRDLDLEDKDELWVGSYQFNVAEGFVGCIRGLVRDLFTFFSSLSGDLKGHCHAVLVSLKPFGERPQNDYF